MLRATIATEFFLINLTFLIMYTLTLGLFSRCRKLSPLRACPLLDYCFYPMVYALQLSTIVGHGQFYIYYQQRILLGSSPSTAVT